MTGEHTASISFTRRELARGLGLVAIGGLGGFLLGRNSSAGPASAANNYGYSPPKKSSSTGRRLAAVDKIPLGGGLILGGPKIVLTRDSAGGVHGFSAVCTHQGCTVGQVRAGVIVCPCHGSKFDAKTGRVVHGPAPAPLPPVPLTITAGVVYAH
jgi:Rieske Fe-S protein